MAKLKFKAPENKVIPAEAKVIFRVFEFEVKDSKSSEFQYINWTLIVEDTFVDDEQTSDYNDMRVWHITSFNPKATFALMGLLQAVDAPFEEDESGQISFDTDDVIGKAVTAIVSVKEYQGKESNQVSKFLPLEQDAE